MKKITLSFLAFILLASGKALAAQWQIVGPRAIGMGGAYVAVVNDATAQYWNPGAFGFFDQEQEESKESSEKKEKADDKSSRLGADYSDRVFGIHLDAGGGVQFQDDLLDKMDDLEDTMDKVDFDQLESYARNGTLPVGKIADALEVYTKLDDIAESDLAVTAMFNANLAVRFGHLGIGIYSFSELAGSAGIDLTNLMFAGGGSTDTMIDDWINNNPITPSDPSTALTQSQDDQINQLAKNNGFSAAQAEKLVAVIDYSLEQAGYNKGSNQVSDDIFNAAVDFANSVSAGGSGTLNLDKNDSSITFLGISTTEVPVTYGYAVNDYLSVGGNLKYMQGKVFYQEIKLFDQAGEDNPFKNAYDDAKTSSSYGVDLGIMGRIPQLRMGLVARNVNRPTFSVDKNSGLKHFAIDPQMRAGVAYVPCGWFTLAVDMDVTRNRSAYDGYYSRLLSAGMELKAFNFLMFRLGGYSNIGDNTKHDQLVLTAGVGVNLWLVRADIGAAMSPDTQRIGGSTVPSEARGQASLSIQF